MEVMIGGGEKGKRVVLGGREERNEGILRSHAYLYFSCPFWVTLREQHILLLASTDLVLPPLLSCLLSLGVLQLVQRC